MRRTLGNQETSQFFNGRKMCVLFNFLNSSPPTNLSQQTQSLVKNRTSPSLRRSYNILIMPSLLIQSGVRLLLTITLALQYSDGFRTDGGNEFIGPSSSTRAETQISSSIALPYDAFAKDDEPSTMMTVNFLGETAMSSEVAAVDESKSLHDFFAMHPHIFLEGAKNNHINEHININDDLFKRYELVCHELGASAPTPNDSRLFDVTTSGLKFPGLAVVQSIATIGVKTITSEQHPCYEIVVVKDKTQLKGRFSSNKVTSPGNNEQTTTSVNRISVVPREDGMIAFESNAALSLSVQFPSFLSASKNSLEKTGCDSIQKVRGSFFLFLCSSDNRHLPC